MGNQWVNFDLGPNSRITPSTVRDSTLLMLVTPTAPPTPGVGVPANLVTANAWRCDAEVRGTGCVAPLYAPTVVFNTALNPKGRPAALHMRDAQNQLSQHWGKPGSGNPLHRMIDQTSKIGTALPRVPLSYPIRRWLQHQQPQRGMTYDSHGRRCSIAARCGCRHRCRTRPVDGLDEGDNLAEVRPDRRGGPGVPPRGSGPARTGCAGRRAHPERSNATRTTAVSVRRQVGVSLSATTSASVSGTRPRS